MLKNWFGKRAPPAPVPDTAGRLVYAVGDIHGRADLLQQLLAAILADVKKRAPKQRALLIFLGDYVDRGPASKEVIDQILALSDHAKVEVLALKGNHEVVLLDFLADAKVGRAWVQHGGAVTLQSYGVAAPSAGAEAEPWEEARAQFERQIPQAHRRFLEGLQLYATCGAYLFVHAGIRPGVPLEEQTERDMLWIRDDFLEAAGDTWIVVHGHTPTMEPAIRPWRLGIDTGAYATNILTAVCLFGAERALIQTRRVS